MVVRARHTRKIGFWSPNNHESLMGSPRVSRRFTYDKQPVAETARIIGAFAFSRIVEIKVETRFPFECVGRFAPHISPNPRSYLNPCEVPGYSWTSLNLRR